MHAISDTARLVVQSTIALVSGILIVGALAFGAVALAVTGLVIGFVGAILSCIRPPENARHAVVTLEAQRTGRGWSVDTSSRR